tara:strand:- start:54585 stop:54728 length:144 start_codon:yes stop_codon:yes gene_type:complete
MKKMIITLVVAVLVSGCMTRQDFCEITDAPATLHPVMSCANCSWKEL